MCDNKDDDFDDDGDNVQRVSEETNNRNMTGLSLIRNSATLEWYWTLP